MIISSDDKSDLQAPQSPISATATVDKPSSSQSVKFSDLSVSEDNSFPEASIRPQKLHDFIGQSKLKKQLHIILQSAQAREAIPDHTMFYGQPGLGKTTLARLIAEELGLPFKIIAAPALQRNGDVVSLLLNLEPQTVLFIDEIHRLRTTLEETLYTAMEDRQVDVVMGKGHGAQPVRFDLPPLTIVGATTMLGKVSKPMIDRFPNVFQLQPYQQDEIIQLVERNADLMDIRVDDPAKKVLASRCRGVPRVLNNLLKRLRDVQTVKLHEVMTGDLSSDFFEEIGIYEYGLTQSDLRYLNALRETALGIKTLSAILGEDSETVEYLIEPYLLQLGLIDKTTRGRILTIKGQNMLEEFTQNRMI
jgi:Holliday junction DNA helicase RuvB